MQRTIGFLDEEDRSTERRRRRTNKPLSQVFVDIFFEDFEFSLREVVDGTEDWLEPSSRWM